MQLSWILGAVTTVAILIELIRSPLLRRFLRPVFGHPRDTTIMIRTDAENAEVLEIAGGPNDFDPETLKAMLKDGG